MWDEKGQEGEGRMEWHIVVLAYWKWLSSIDAREAFENVTCDVIQRERRLQVLWGTRGDQHLRDLDRPWLSKGVYESLEVPCYAYLAQVEQQYHEAVYMYLGEYSELLSR